MNIFLMKNNRIDMGKCEKGEEPKRSNREKIVERYKNKYPDREFADDEQLFEQVNGDYDAYDKEIGEYKTREKTLQDLFRTDPRSARLFINWSNGGNPTTELVRQFGADIVASLNDPDKQEEIAAANQEFVERAAKSKALEEKYPDNLAKSLEACDKMQKEKGYSDEQIDKAFELIERIMLDAVAGNFEPAYIEMAIKAIDYDNDVAAASESGEIRGRNAKIEEQMEKSRKGDGIPYGGGNMAKANSGQRMGGALGRLDSTQSIWERGGEKRTKYV